MRFLLPLTGLLLASGTAAAQNRPLEATVGFDLITNGIEKAVADSAGIGGRAYGFTIPFSLIAMRVLSVNADVGVLFLSDEDAFTVDTNLGERSSAVTSLTWALSAGVRTPRISLGGEKPLFAAAGVNAGRNFVNMHRSVANCPTCPTEDIEVRAGNFVEGVLEVGTGRGTVVGRYRAYGSDSDLRDALLIGYSVPMRSQRKPAEVPPAAP